MLMIRVPDHEICGTPAVGGPGLIDVGRPLHCKLLPQVPHPALTGGVANVDISGKSTHMDEPGLQSVAIATFLPHPPGV